MYSKIIILLLMLSFSPISDAVEMEACSDPECVSYFTEFKQYAKRGYADAMYALGDMYFTGYGTTKDIKKAVKSYRKSARFGSALAQFKLGYLYLTNQSLHDYDAAISYLKKAARNRNGDAAYILGVIYYDQKFGDHSLEESDKWLAKSYKYNNKEVRDFIAHLYDNNRINEDDFPDLFELLSDIEITPIAAQNVNETETTPTVMSSGEAKISQAINKPRRTTIQWPEDDGTEIIKVSQPSLSEILDYEISRFAYISPEKYRVNTGSNIRSQTCERNMSCGAMSKEEFSRLAMGAMDLSLTALMGGN